MKLTDDNLRLCPIDGADFAIVKDLRSRYASEFFDPRPLSEVDHAYWTEQYQHGHDQLQFLIRTRDDRVIGMVGLSKIDYLHRRAKLGRLVIECDQRKKGYAKAAVEFLCSYAFNILNLRRLYLEVLASNEAALALYQGCGFQIEGTLRGHIYRDGRYEDVVVMGQT